MATKKTIQDTNEGAEKPQEMKLAHWWARESGSLYLTEKVDGVQRKVRFKQFCVTLDLADPVHSAVNEMLKSHRSRNVDYHLVVDQKNDASQQKQMMALIRDLLSPSSDGHVDDVAKNSGILKLSAMFTDDELKALDTSRTNPDIDLLTLQASANKYIQGVE